MKILSISVLAAALFFFACNNKLKIQTSSFNLNESFQMKMLETAKITNGNLQITFTGLPEDSRCPEDANCIWEGQVRLFIDAVIPEKKESIEFKIEKSRVGKVSRNFADYTILVEDVQPQNKSGAMIAKEDYTITLKVMPK